MSEPTGTSGPAPTSTDQSTAPTTSNDTGTGDNTGADNSGGGHPAWQPFLDFIPGALHEGVKTRLSEYDKAANGRIEKVQSDFAPYKVFAEQGIGADQLTEAHNVFRNLNENPQGFFELLANHLGYDLSGQGQQTGPVENDLDEIDLDSGEPNIAENPYVKQMAAQVEQMQSYLQSREDAQRQQESDAWAARRMGELPEGVDTDYIATKVSTYLGDGSKMTPDQAFDAAVKNYNDHVSAILAQPRARDSAPNVLSPSGGSPVGPNTRTMKGKELRAAAAERLAQLQRS